MGLRPSLRRVVAQLAAEGLATPEEVAALAGAPRLSREEPSPWFVRLLLGGGAWLAAVLLVLFLWLSELVASDPAAVWAGGLLCLASVLLARTAVGKGWDFLEQLALALGLAGQLFVVFGVGEWSGSAAAAAGVALLLALLLLVVHPDRVQRFLSVPFAALALVVLLREARFTFALDGVALLLAAAAGWAWEREPRLALGSLAGRQTAVGFGAVTALFLILLPTAASDLDLDVAVAGWPTTLGLALGLAALVRRIGAERGVGAASEPALAATASIVLLGLATLRAPGVLAATGVLVLAFHRRNPLLLGLAAIFLVLFGSAFYYHLEMTLLAKSGILVASGGVLLGFRFYLTRRLGRIREGTG